LMIGLAVPLLHHFAFYHPRTTFIYDSRSYLSTTATIAQCLKSIISGHGDMTLVSAKQFLATIVNDGPVMTTTFAAIFTLLGHIPENKDWTTFQIIQSVMHALSAALVYIAAKRATKDETAAIVAGLAWATYPAAVINSGRFYNEPLMILLMLLSLVLTSRVPTTAACTTGGSYFSGLTFLMKPALLAGAALSYLSLFLSPKSKALALAFIALGVMLAFGPWALYTKTNLGKAYFTTPRNSSYNFAMGNDTEVDGVVTSPMPPLTTIFINDPAPVYFMFSQWSDNTAAYLTMELRKATRMYANPWNDFRQKYFGLDAQAQQIWHLLLLFGGLTGTIIFIWQRLAQDKINYAQNSVQILSLGWLLAPTVYLLFEANSRYGFSITPFLAVFMAVPVALWKQSGWNKPQPRLIIAISAAAVLTLLIANLDNLTRLDQSKETVLSLAPHQVAGKRLSLASSHKPSYPGSRIFIMVDGDERLSQAGLKLNGRSIQGSLTHLRYFYPSKYSEYYVFQELGYAMGELPEDYRQWRIVEIPPDLVNWQGDNTIELTAGDKGATIYGESVGETRHYLSPRFYSPIKLGNASKGLETRLVMPEIKANILQQSYIGNSGLQNVQPGSLRIHLLLADQLDREPVANAAVTAGWPARARHFDLGSKNFDPCFSTGNASELHISRHVLDAASSVCAEFSIPRTEGSNAVKLKLTGMIRAARAGSKVGLLLASKNKAGQPVLVSKTPPYVPAGPDWQPFTVEDILPQGELAEGPITVTVGIYPGPWEEICGYNCDRRSAEAVIKDMKLDMAPTYQLDLTSYRLLLL